MHQLTALGDSAMLEDAQQLFVDAALLAGYGDKTDDVDRAGDGAEVLEDDSIDGRSDGHGAGSMLGEDL